MNLNLLQTIESHFNSNIDKIWTANSLIYRAEFLFKNTKMDYWQENVNALLEDIKKYQEHSKPASLIMNGKDLVEIGKYDNNKQ